MCLRSRPDPAMTKGDFGEKGRPIVKYRDPVSCAKTAKPIEMPFGIGTQMGPDRTHGNRQFLGEINALACPTSRRHCRELCKNG